MPVPDAAKALGISPEAVRNRLSRGTLRSEKVDGRVSVLIDRDMVRHTERHVDDTPNGVPPNTSGLVEEMRARIEDLRDQLEAERAANRENRRIIAGLIERVPAIEAPQNDQGDAQRPSDGSVGMEREKPEGRSWWRRLFGE